ncbi:hypothetical protein KAX02_13185 [candidate division WOR-3 bacterium]|nr:hypothetical protein [candidate division WOR-3 bacterium]
MKKISKLTKLRKEVDSTTNDVQALVETLDIAREKAAVLDTIAEEELKEAQADFEATKAGYKELQSRCSKTISFVNKIMGE